MTAPCEGLTFEEAVQELEGIVAALETGSLSLDASMERFERAVALSRHCAARLESAERRIRVIESETYVRDAVEVPDEPSATLPHGPPPARAATLEEFDPFAD